MRASSESASPSAMYVWPCSSINTPTRESRIARMGRMGRYWLCRSEAGPADGSASRGCRGRRTTPGPNGFVRSGAGMPPRRYRGRTLTLSTAPAIVYGALAGFAAASGAEWSLFWPTIGIALDSWARVILSLDRPAAAPCLGFSLAGARTESAAGTDVSAAVDGVVPAWTWAGFTSGTGGSERSLSQAVSSSSEDRHKADSVNGVHIPLLSGCGVWRASSCTSVWASMLEQDSQPRHELLCAIRRRRHLGGRSSNSAFQALAFHSPRSGLRCAQEALRPRQPDVPSSPPGGGSPDPRWPASWCRATPPGRLC